MTVDEKVNGPPHVLFCWHGDLEHDRGGDAALALGRLKLLISLGYEVHLLSDTSEEAQVASGCHVIWKYGDFLYRRIRRYRYRCLGDAGINCLISKLNTSDAKSIHKQMIDEWEGLREIRGRAKSAVRTGVPSSYCTQRNESLIVGAEQLVQALAPDIVFVSHLSDAIIFDSCPDSTCKVLDAHDGQHRRTSHDSDVAGNCVEISCVLEAEVAALRKADLLIGVQGDETSFLRGVCPGVGVVTAGHVPDISPRLHSLETSMTLLYVAGSNESNVRGLMQFLKEDWPALRKAGWQLRVVGSLCTAFDSPVKGVEFLGAVDDLAPHYVDAAIVLNLAAYGRGLPIKTIEGLAAGKIVLSRHECSDCFGDDVPLLRFHSGEAAASIAHLCSDKTARSELETSVACFAKTALSQDVVYRDLRAALGEQGSVVANSDAGKVRATFPPKARRSANAQSYPLIAYFGHHKCGTNWIRTILGEVAEASNLSYAKFSRLTEFDGLPAEHVATHGLQLLSWVNVDSSCLAGLDYLGFHVVRDPRDVIASAYFSHLKTHNTANWPKLIPFREKLQTVTKEEGLLMEIKFCEKQWQRMEAWPTRNSRAMTVRLEDFGIAYRSRFKSIFDFVGLFDRGLSEDAFDEIMTRNAFQKRSGGRKHGEEDRSSHFRKGVHGDWRNHFNDDHVAAVKERLNDLLLKYEYETNPDWS